jgi:hypothetical protein
MSNNKDENWRPLVNEHTAMLGKWHHKFMMRNGGCFRKASIGADLHEKKL